mmetsp:Transcript_86516/g.242263  ORF Transcript_86516/g.242263 Transcript_86516/m.242263 type:complete len:208 (+) Transcript_86516:663-1286(+)
MPSFLALHFQLLWDGVLHEQSLPPLILQFFAKQSLRVLQGVRVAHETGIFLLERGGQTHHVRFQRLRLHPLLRSGKLHNFLICSDRRTFALPLQQLALQLTLFLVPTDLPAAEVLQRIAELPVALVQLIAPRRDAFEFLDGRIPLSHEQGRARRMSGRRFGSPLVRHDSHGSRNIQLRLEFGTFCFRCAQLLGKLRRRGLELLNFGL